MTRLALLCVLLCSCTISGPTSLPNGTAVVAGDGIKIGSDGKVSVDPATAHAATADQLGGVAAVSYQTAAAADAKYLGKTAQAADSAKVGGFAPASFAVKDSGGNVDLGAGRVVLSFGTGATAASTSAFGLFCGQTAGTNGNVTFTVGMATTNGYQGAKKNCEAVATCGALAHMCTPAEMISSLGVGAINFASFAQDSALWVASGVRWDVTGAPPTVSDDCNGYTSAAASPNFGAVFVIKASNLPKGVPDKKACSLSNPVACCQ